MRRGFLKRMEPYEWTDRLEWATGGLTSEGPEDVLVGWMGEPGDREIGFEIKDGLPGKLFHLSKACYQDGEMGVLTTHEQHLILKQLTELSGIDEDPLYQLELISKELTYRKRPSFYQINQFLETLRTSFETDNNPWKPSYKLKKMDYLLLVKHMETVSLEFDIKRGVDVYRRFHIPKELKKTKKSCKQILLNWFQTIENKKADVTIFLSWCDVVTCSYI